MMDEIKIAEFAASLLDAHGDAAEAEAAKKTRVFEESGETQLADDWRKIKAVIASRRGPRAS
jgi:hypothetical protein